MSKGAEGSRTGSAAVARHRQQSARRETELRLVLGELEVLRRAALVDPLTGLWNRRGLESDVAQRLAVARRGGRPVTVVVGDMDGLKAINDRQGHSAGDQALQDLASAFYGALRTGDTAYRIGGDEFVLLLPDTGAEEAEAVVARVSAAAPAFSWGAATFPGDGLDSAALVEAADQRMLERRRDARGTRTETSHEGSRRSRLRGARMMTAALIATGMLGGVAAGLAGERIINPVTGEAVVDTRDSAPAQTQPPDPVQPTSVPVPDGAGTSSTASVTSTGQRASGPDPVTVTTDLVDAVTDTLPQETPKIRVNGIEVRIPVSALIEGGGELVAEVDPPEDSVQEFGRNSEKPERPAKNRP